MASTKPKKPAKQFVSLALKILFAAGLLFLLFRRGLISLDAMHGALQKWEITGPAVGALLLATFLGVWRWHWLLQAQGISLTWKRTFQLTLIGNFFNIALPGAVSGDFVKAFYIGREVEGKRARAFSSILFDRVAGLSALFLLSAAALAGRRRQRPGAALGVALGPARPARRRPGVGQSGGPVRPGAGGRQPGDRHHAQRNRFCRRWRVAARRRSDGAA